MAPNLIFLILLSSFLSCFELSDWAFVPYLPLKAIY